MKKLSSAEIRQMFLDFFASKGHMIEPSASLVPVNDPSLLWINSGVAALKKYFDGREKPRSNRIANAQKSIRTNDIENVGKTARHHTFFEMLGNFSIGDYFKEDALCYAYEFLTSKEYLDLDPNRLYVSVYTDDHEAYDIWTKKIGFPASHILKTDNNFWQIGEGPSGPDSEIFYDRGEKYDPLKLGEKLFFEELENDRYIEVWNVVFSQYDAKEGVDRKDFKELPQKNIDTGMGLERLVSIIQEGETNFDTDLFLPIIREIEQYAKIPYSDDSVKMAYRVIADHVRTITFALADGAIFANEGRGYVLRRVIRRAIRYNIKLGINEAFIYKLVPCVARVMEAYYPYLNEKIDFIKTLVEKEENSFYHTLKNGEKLLAEELNKAKDSGIISGEVIFKLYDTYGYPKELSFEIASDHNLKIDYEGFEKAMQRQKELARSFRDNKDSMHNQSAALLNYQKSFTFLGYENTICKAKLEAIFHNDEFINEADSDVVLIFDQSVFYAESGGQIADKGIIKNDDVLLEVIDVKKAPNGQFLHFIKHLKGKIKVGEDFILEVDAKRRDLIKANHSSLHLLHSALRAILGTHIAQAGSYVSDTYARFDFSHYAKITKQELSQIELFVNEAINKAIPIYTKVLALEEAKKENAIALFDEKYEDIVRVVCMDEVSKEFCGGIHADNTAFLGSFKIISEESIGSGIRRIECKTKLAAYHEFNSKDSMLDEICDNLKLTSHSAIVTKIDSLLNNIKELEKENNELKERMINLSTNTLINKVVNKGAYNLLITKFNTNDLRTFIKNLETKIDNAIIIIFSENDNRLTYAISVNKKLLNNFSAKEIIKQLSTLLNGNGGGKADFAQGGANPVRNLDEIIAKFSNLFN